MKKATANLKWSLFVMCPHCEYAFDLASDNNDSIIKAIFNNKWDDIKIVTCPDCEMEFKVVEEY